MLTIMYLTGLVMVSISVGFTQKQTDGWMVLGIGLIIYSFSVGIIKYLNSGRGGG